jgi:XTP/dITP diphosphohydrolase
VSGSRIVLATRNPGKLAELDRILAASGLTFTLAGLDEFPGAPEVAETGRTFEENALLKARSAAAHTGLPAVADDSGLCVDALNGMPGVLSARWAGRHGDDQANLELVLAQLAEVADPDRGAHFTCAAAIVVPEARRAGSVPEARRAGSVPEAYAHDGGGRPGEAIERVVEGRPYGRLTRAPRGTNGFGYDPIFLPDSSPLTTGDLTTGDLTTGDLTTGDLTTGEMEPAAKDAISHRGRALRALVPVIAELLGGD